MTWSRSATSNRLTAWEALVFSQCVGPPPALVRLTSPSGGGSNTWRATVTSAERAASAAGHEEQPCLPRPAASARSAQRSLTPRSSRAPTACHAGPAGGTRYIFATRARASHRWCRLNSNVRPHTKCSPTFVASFGTQPARDTSTSNMRLQLAWSSDAEQPRRSSTRNRREFIRTRSSWVCLVQLIELSFTNPGTRKVRRIGLSPFSFKEGDRSKSGKSQTKLTPPSSALESPPSQVGQSWSSHENGPKMHLSFTVARVRPNTSLKLSTNGRPPGPGRWYAVHFHRPGPGVLPLAPA